MTPWRCRLAGLLALGVGMVWAGSALAQSMTLDLGDGSSSTGRIVQLVALTTVLSLVPGILVTVTSFTRIIIVLSFLRSAMGIQQTPPNVVMISLALFLSLFVMTPTFERSYADGIEPLMAEKISETEALTRTVAPVHRFMMAHLREQDLKLFVDLAKLGPIAEPADTPLRVVIPAFMISEMRRAFEIGFLLFLPFLIIDIVVAALIMSMGIVSLPPNVISLPFKLIFFVLIDGWYLVAGSLVQSFGPG